MEKGTNRLLESRTERRKKGKSTNSLRTIKNTPAGSGRPTIESEQAEIHNEAIRELGDSLEAEVSPMVVEVQGRTVELTGSIEEQYQQWRKLLREIYVNETGFAYEDTVTDTESAQL